MPNRAMERSFDLNIVEILNIVENGEIFIFATYINFDSGNVWAQCCF
jgi:hypothetical protein